MKRTILSVIFVAIVTLTANAQWTTVGSAGFSKGTAFEISLTLNSSGIPYVVFRDGGDTVKCRVMKYDGTAWVNVGSTVLDTSLSNGASIACHPTSGQPYVAYMNNSSKAAVKKFNGTSWVNVGLEGFSSQIGYGNLPITINPSGKLYVAYSDAEHLYKATVMTYDGTSWVNVGTAGFTAGEAGNISLTSSPSGEPYIAYYDTDSSGRATVVKYDGTNWVNVGKAGFSSGEILKNVSLAFHPTTGEVYAAFIDYGNAYKVTVMKFDGTKWLNVGSIDGTSAQDSWVSLAINSTGEPCVVYVDDSYNAIVKKFNDTTWVNIGTESITTPSAIYNDLIPIAFSPTTKEPYVAYGDGLNSNKATVMKFVEVPTSIRNLNTINNSITVYPNPTKLQINFSVSANVQLTSLTGQIIADKKNVNSLDLSDLPTGMYFLVLTNNNGQVMQRSKIVKE